MIIPVGSEAVYPVQQVLDDGIGTLQLIEGFGSDKRIVEAARMSTDKGFLGWGPRTSELPCDRCDGAGVTDDRGFALTGQPFFSKMECRSCGGDGKKRVPGDEKLLEYLYKNKHNTPFEMAGLVIEIKAPIFVFREWHRHRTQSFNEMSARYIPLPDESYIPSIERIMRNQKDGNKQAGTIKDAAELTEEVARNFQLNLQDSYEEQESLYQWALKAGIPKELARIPLPVARYSKMRAFANLRNWLAFLTLRNHPAAQWEIQQYAQQVAVIIQEQYPRTYELFCTYK